MEKIVKIRETGVNSESQRKSSFEKLKDAWKKVKDGAKGMTAALVVGAMVASTSCGEGVVTTQRFNDSGTTVVNDTGNNTQKDANDVKDTGKDDSWTPPQEYVDVCNTNGDRSKVREYICKIPLNENLKEYLLSNKEGYDLNGIYYEGKFYAADKDFFTVWTKNPNTCSYDLKATEFGRSDLSILISSTIETSAYILFACNCGPVGKYVIDESGGRTHYKSTTVLIRLRETNKEYYEEIKKQFE